VPDAGTIEIERKLTRPSPTFRLLAGLATTLLAVGVYSGYTVLQLRSLKKLQTETIDRNRTDTLLLLRIQNGLNSLALTMRDMLDEQQPYPLTAWAPQFRRIRSDLEDALSREKNFSLADLSTNQRRYLADSFRQFWDALDRIYNLANKGGASDIDEARTQIRLSLQAREAALSTAVSRLLVQNNENERAAAVRTEELYSGVERNVYIFLAAMLVVILLTSLYLVDYNRKLFDRVEALSTQRGDLAQQLISMQENIFRSISRDLHDDFGQILTAIGVMLQRTARHSPDVLEVREIVQAALEKVRALSHALHPVVLDEAGLDGALDSYLPGFERQTGVAVDYRKEGQEHGLSHETTTHLYRVTQEALTNVAKHSGSKRASVRLRFAPHAVTLEIEDDGKGIRENEKQGLGLVSMRERAEMMKGKIDITCGESGGTLVRVTVPTAAEPVNA
jgi:signal transduction histidine kinase